MDKYPEIIFLLFLLIPFAGYVFSKGEKKFL